MIKTVSVVVENEVGKILALKRSAHKKWYPGRWDIISGKIVDNESPSECFFREIKEEIGGTEFISVSEKEPYVYQEGRHIWHVYPFLAVVKNNTTFVLNKEHSEYQWVTVQELLQRECASPLTYELNKIYVQ
ncbi:NUDIX domain-containing protein [Patescibacteria group bacterium]|nr:NUDIX domain-containing protein [Patescibacteria group bacterium]